MGNIVELIAHANTYASVDVLASGGLNSLWNTILTNWITPLFIAMVAVFALIFIKDRAWMKLIAFIGIAAIVGVLVFAGSALFGPSGNLTKAGKGLASKVQTVDTAGGVVGFADSANPFSE